MKFKKKLIWILCLAVFSLPTEVLAKDEVSKTPSQRLKTFLELSEELRKNLGVPGVGIALVYENDVIYTGGLGFRDLEKKLPVNANTLFSIGSNTKGFTGVITAKLVSRELMAWDAPLKKYVPEFKLKEPYVAEHATVADALAHRVGVERNSGLWKYKTLSRPELLEKFDQLECKFKFRQGFNYCNMMYMLVGVAQERVTNQTWEELIQKEILDPLGMSDSTTTSAAFMESQHRAIGYRGDGMRPAPPVDLTSIAPAGAIGSTPKDISRWIKMIVNNGQHEGQDFLSNAEHDYLFRPHSSLSIRNGDELWFYYGGLGGFVKDGKRNIGANGGIDGQNSRCVLLPDDGFGILVMTNKVSEYKELVAQYAEQIFVDGELKRDRDREQLLASQASFQKFWTYLADQGPEVAKAEYGKMKFKPHEDYMNQLGYQLMQGEEMEQAKFVFETNVNGFPESVNAHDSLAESMMRSEDFEGATKHYQKSLELDPNNANATEMLKRIKELTSSK